MHADLSEYNILVHEVSSPPLPPLHLASAFVRAVEGGLSLQYLCAVLNVRLLPLEQQPVAGASVLPLNIAQRGGGSMSLLGRGFIRWQQVNPGGSGCAG